MFLEDGLLGCILNALPLTQQQALGCCQMLHWVENKKEIIECRVL
jgi:hypothetical protein